MSLCNMMKHTAGSAAMIYVEQCSELTNTPYGSLKRAINNEIIYHEYLVKKITVLKQDGTALQTTQTQLKIKSTNPRHFHTQCT